MARSDRFMDYAWRKKIMDGLRRQKAFAMKIQASSFMTEEEAEAASIRENAPKLIQQAYAVVEALEKKPDLLKAVKEILNSPIR